MSEPLLYTLTNTAIAAWHKRKAKGPRASLAGKVIVITGGSSGNGRATALECAVRGASLVLAARGLEDLQKVGAEVESLGAKVLLVPTDISERAQVDSLLERTLSEFGRVDVWFNNASDAFFASAVDGPLEHIEHLLSVNLWGTMYGVRAAVKVMREQGHGHIFNMTSTVGKVAFPYFGVYAASKAFVELYTQALRQELMYVEKSGIRVSTVAPPAVRTPFFDKIPNYVQGGRGGYLTGPVLDPEAVGRAVADGIVHYRPVIYPLASSQALVVLNGLWPTLMDRVLSHLRADAPRGPYTSRIKGSHRDEAHTKPRAQIEAQHARAP